MHNLVLISQFSLPWSPVSILSLFHNFWDTLSLLETALAARMDLEHIQPSPCPAHQAASGPVGVPPHVELPQPHALLSGGHLLQQVAHRLKAQTAPDEKDSGLSESEIQKGTP